MDYLRTAGVSDADFAREVGASLAAVRKWKYATRAPRPAAIARIKIATDGLVTADDFFDVRIPPDSS